MIARFKDLCIDANDAGAVGEFWAGLLGLGFERLPNGDAALSGPTKQHTIWVNTVPEGKTVKNRVHLDVASSDVAARLQVRHDPEGAEYCALSPDLPPGLMVDSVDPVTQAAWWAGVLGGEIVPGRDGRPRWISGIEDFPWGLLKFLDVPEPKTVKNRVHWDVTGERQALLDAGATMLRERDDEIRWDVMADPEGNEFCRFDP